MAEEVEEPLSTEQQVKDLKDAGDLLFGLQKFEEAVEKYTAALKIDSNHSRVYSNRSLAYIHLQKWKRAVHDATNAVTLDPKYVNGWLHLADAQEGHHHYEQAIEAFEKAKSLSKDPAQKAKIDEEIERSQASWEDQKIRHAAKKSDTLRSKKSDTLRDVEPAGPVTELTTTKSVNTVTSAETEVEESEDSVEDETDPQFAEAPINVEEEVDGTPCCTKQWCKELWHVGNIANLVSVIIMAVGFALKYTLPKGHLGALIVYNCGMFAFSGGATNGIAIKMLFDKIPGVVGSGVIPSRFVEIREIVKNMIMKNFFDEVYLNYYLKKKLVSMDFEKMIDDLIKEHNVADMIVEMAIADPTLAATARTLIKPYVNDMATRLAPIISQGIEEIDFGKGMQSAQGEIENMLDTKLATLTPNAVKKMIEDIIRIHLYWLVMWGAVFGGLLGVISALIGLPG